MMSNITYRIAGKCDYHMIKMGHYYIKYLCDLLVIATLSLPLHKTKINTTGMDSHQTL